MGESCLYSLIIEISLLAPLRENHANVQSIHFSTGHRVFIDPPCRQTRYNLLAVPCALIRAEPIRARTCNGSCLPPHHVICMDRHCRRLSPPNALPAIQGQNAARTRDGGWHSVCSFNVSNRHTQGLHKAARPAPILSRRLGSGLTGV